LSEARNFARELGGQNFDGYITTKFRITGAVNLSHPARTDSGENFIGAQVGAGLNGHRSPTIECAEYNVKAIYALLFFRRHRTLVILLA
jgi:hypothetical protein